MAKLSKESKPRKEGAKWIGGRKPKDDDKLCTYYYGFRLNENDNEIFLNLMKRSGAKNITEFITKCVFDKPFQVVTIDKSALDICIEISETNSQIRLIGVNYNQITKTLKTTFTEKKALAFLYKLEKHTIELVSYLQKIVAIIDNYEKKWLQK